MATVNPANIKQALVAFLLADPGVRAIIGESLYPEVGTDVPGDFPRLTYEQVKKVDDTTLGLSTDQPETWISLTAYGRGASGYADADALTAAVRNARGPDPSNSRLKEWSAAWMPLRGHPSAVWVKGVRLDEEMSAAAQLAVDKSKKWIFQIVSVFSFTWNELLYS